MFLRYEKHLIKKKIEDKKLDYLVHVNGMITLTRFLIVAEDCRFYKHRGFDIKAIFRALYNNTFKGRHEGASTIDQQLVRVITNDYRHSVRRKIKEIILAYWMDRHYSKDIICICYLLNAYYGTRYPGLNDYLSINKINLYNGIDEIVAANIVARLKYPEPECYNRKIETKIARRVNYILYLNDKCSKNGK